MHLSLSNSPAALQIINNRRVSATSRKLIVLTKRTFAELLSNYNVSIFNYSASDISRDVANA